MPPKKAGKAGGKASKGGKKPDKKDAKKKETTKTLTKQDKKLIKKFGDLKFEGPNGREEPMIWMKRDELEVVAETLRDQLTLTRRERIKFMLERDFFFDSMKAYEEKVNCLLEEEKLKEAEELKATQDVADLETVKNMEGKHFRYEVQMTAAQLDIKNELRRQKLKDWLDKSWQKVYSELDRQSAILNELNKTNREKINEVRASLSDLDSYAADHERQLKEYTKTLNKSMMDSIYVLRLQRKLDVQETEERFSEFMWNLAKNYEKYSEQYKQFYIMAAHNCLTYILSMKDDITEVEARKALVQGDMKRIKNDLKQYKAMVKSVQALFRASRTSHSQMENLKRYIAITSQDIVKIDKEIAGHLQEYRHLSHHMAQIDEERIHFRATTDQMSENLLDVYNERYRTTPTSMALNYDKWRREQEKERLATKLDDPSQFWPAVRPYMQQMNERDIEIEKQRLRAIQISKQHDDTRNALEARMVFLGLKTKYKTILPQQSHVATRSQRLDWGPAGLVARKEFPLRPQIARLPKYMPTEEADDDLEVCVTESVERMLDIKSTHRNNNIHSNQDEDDL